ncbi:MAG: Ammonium transporter [uncultured Solirubrobacteraceae bacterium]|uniref:Ammonium transporter n=1 Tax=uncultured Solirubrobacteraceae bacterium TaxID=1162706 RepID=A0A6J4TLR7_9ACTN|nr:MAG: Ammonium transporter [uncultured Solirubrobacteraceae bacterium]
MSRPRLAGGALLGILALLALPATGFAQDQIDPQTAIPQLVSELNSTWIIVAAVLVMFMQAGFLFLEIGFSRGKNVGSGVAKILVNFSIATIVWWALGFGIAFGGADLIAGDSGFFPEIGTTMSEDSLIPGPFTGASAAFMLFQFMFCAVSLAIVWGTTLERIKFIAYVVFAIVFAGLIYPLVAHWGFGGGIFARIGPGVQDFAGSSVVHLTGATAALAALLLLGPRKGKYGPDGRARGIPGHSMPIFGLGVFILWLGWFGFNAGSTLGTGDGRFAEVAMVTQLGAAGGVVGASILIAVLTKKLDVGMAGNGAIAGLVAITAPSGYVEMWAAPIIGFVGGLIVVAGVLAIDKKLDDPVGALSAHGLAGIWGTLACGLFTSERLAETVGVGQAGLFQGGGLGQLGAQAAAVALTFAFVLAASLLTFAAIKAVFGLRVSEEDEEAGLDIAEHGMYGYPEQFIPAPELVGYTPTGAPPDALSRGAVATKKEIPA